MRPLLLLMALAQLPCQLARKEIVLAAGDPAYQAYMIYNEATAVQAAGGLIVAVVVKLLDNVAKVFAASFGIVLTGVVSAVLFEFRPNLQFIVGTALVLCSTVIYSQPDQKPRRRRRRRRRRWHGGSKPILPTKGRISRSREAK